MAKMIVNVEVNGERQELLTEPYRTLLDLLRDNLSLTGTKEGCALATVVRARCCLTVDRSTLVSCLLPKLKGVT